MTKSKTRFIIRLLLFLSCFTALLIWRTWKAIRQDSLNTRLIANIKKLNYPEAIRLIDLGADPNFREELEDTPRNWHYYFDRAMGRGDPNRGEPAVILAASHDSGAQSSCKVVESLISHGADINSKGEEGKNALDYSISSDEFATVKLLISKGLATLPGYETPLEKALIFHDHKLFNDLVALHMDINQRTSNGGTALLEAGADDLEAEALTLLNLGADMEARDWWGRTALMNSMIQMQDEPYHVLKILIARGAKIEALNNAGETALIFALHWQKNNDAITTLLKYGADPTIHAKDGSTAFSWAKKNHYSSALFKRMIEIGNKLHPARRK